MNNLSPNAEKVKALFPVNEADQVLVTKVEFETLLEAYGSLLQSVDQKELAKAKESRLKNVGRQITDMNLNSTYDLANETFDTFISHENAIAKLNSLFIG